MFYLKCLAGTISTAASVIRCQMFFFKTLSSWGHFQYCLRTKCDSGVHILIIYSLWCQTVAGPVGPPHWLNLSCWQEASWSDQGRGSGSTGHHSLYTTSVISPQFQILKHKLTTAKVLIPFPYTLRGMVLGSSFSFSSFIRLQRK